MNVFLNKFCAERQTVRIWTTNGYQMSGVITDVGEDYIIFEMNGVEQLIYKHAISTIRKEG